MIDRLGLPGSRQAEGDHGARGRDRQDPRETLLGIRLQDEVGWQGVEEALMPKRLNEERPHVLMSTGVLIPQSRYCALPPIPIVFFTFRTVDPGTNQPCHK